MPFATSVKTDVYSRAAGQCECEREHLHGSTNPPHPGGRCPDGGAQETFYFVEKSTGKSPEGSSGKAEDCEMVCFTCYRLGH